MNNRKKALVNDRRIVVQAYMRDGWLPRREQEAIANRWGCSTRSIRDDMYAARDGQRYKETVTV